MTIDGPKMDQIPQLRQLWQEAFGDSDAYLDSFFAIGFSPARCRCVTEEDRAIAALYWFDCSCQGQKLAYIYAVAPAEGHRGRGLCRLLMENTHSCLTAQGYAGAILVPASEELRRMYGKMGYLPGSRGNELTCQAGQTAAKVEVLSREQYERRRRAMLPSDGVVQEGAMTALLADQMGLFGGENFLLAAWIQDGVLHGEELLGDPAVAPGIVNALGVEQGVFHTPGESMAFSMYRPLAENCPKPGYFGIALG